MRRARDYTIFPACARARVKSAAAAERVGKVPRIVEARVEADVCMCVCVCVRVRYVCISGAFGHLNLQCLSGIENCAGGRTCGATCECKHVPLI